MNYFYVLALIIKQLTEQSTALLPSSPHTYVTKYCWLFFSSLQMEPLAATFRVKVYV